MKTSALIQLIQLWDLYANIPQQGKLKETLGKASGKIRGIIGGGGQSDGKVYFSSF